MKRSDKPTAHILIRANTDSKWDNCEFAIISLSEPWRKQQKERLELVKILKKDLYFSSMNFYEESVEFYACAIDDNITELLQNKEWSFVELDNKQRETFALPENSLNCYRITLQANGTAYYTTYGKYTDEKFWTADFLLTSLIEQP